MTLIIINFDWGFSRQKNGTLLSPPKNDKGNSGYATLHGKRDLADMITFKMLKCEMIPGYPSEPEVITRA